MINKFFTWKKLYNPMMKYRDSMIDHLNDFNIVIIQLVNVDTRISDDDKCIIFYRTHGIVRL
jgi:hypothetical protein